METYADAGGEIARRMRDEWGDFQQTIGAPIIVGGELWGVMVISRSRGDPFPVGTEEDRLASFTELIAIAVSNAAGAEQLAASRARVVAAADESRRRIERDLHDGAQQRLVSLALRLRSAQQRFADQPEVAAEFATAVEALTAILENLREISHGLHPAILSKSGLAAALKTLARRSAVPVRLDITLDRRLPDAVEVAAYYVVCEALANAVKHAVASTIDVAAHAEDDTLLISVRDDGVGGASAARGSGITGLRDRVEALGGTLEILSVPEQGTSLTARLPMRLGTLD
jgi:signal transduction histidine kinase